LSSYTELGLMIFCVTFAICYLFAEPQQALGRALGLAMFVTIASISNEQSYNFLSVANTAMMFPIIFFVFVVTAYVPWSPRPERSIMRMLDRFFYSSHYLIDAIQEAPADPASRLDRFKREYYAREITSLPEKVSSCIHFLDDWILSRASQEQLGVLVTSLQLLGYRVEQLITERRNPEPSLIVEPSLDDLQAWEQGIISALLRLSQSPSDLDGVSLRGDLNDRLDSLETKLGEVLDKPGGDQYSEQDIESFYRLLAAYRGVSEALLNYLGAASAIDWAPWREERFV